MKIRMTYKCPDAVWWGIDDALNDCEDDADRRDRRDELYESVIGILGSDEYVTIEVDTDTGFATVVKRR